MTSGGEEHLILRILRVLSRIDFVKESAQQEWTATPITRAMVTPSIQGSHKHVWDMGFMTAAKIPEYMKRLAYKYPTDGSNGPLQYAKQTGLTAIEIIASRPDTLEDFHNMMTGVRLSRPSWVGWFPVHGRLLDGYREDTTLLVDIGGGWGHDLVAFQKAWATHAELELQDLPQVIADVTDLPPNIKCRSHDFFSAEQPVQGARAYFFHFIFHDWTDDQCLRILRNTAPAMTRGYSKILINEYVLPDQGCSITHAMMDINMLAITQGMERTESQWRTLIAQSGLQISKIWTPTGHEEAVLEVVL